MTKLEAMIGMLAAALKLAREDENGMLEYLIGMAILEAKEQLDRSHPVMVAE